MNRTIKNLGMRATLTLLALLCSLTGARAVEVTVGDPDNASNSYGLLMISDYNYSYSQQIYMAEELGTAGTINSITLWMKGKASLPDMSYDLYMVETDKASFSFSDRWLPLNRAEIVCSGTLTVHNTEYQEYTFTLKEPFIYSGKGNLLIAFNKWADTSSSGLSTIGFNATDEVDRTIYDCNDSRKYDPANTGQYFNGKSERRNVVRFDITPKPVADPPATLEVTDITYNSAALMWTGGTQHNNVEYKKEGEERFHYSVLNLTAETSWTLNSLEENTVYYARVQSIDDYQNVSPWKTVQFTTPHEVADLECIAETATTATLSWTENGTATQWYVSYVDDLGTSYGCEADSNPFTLNDLTEGRKYTAKVRASDSDAWSEPVTFEPTSKTVIGRGTATSSDLPTYTNYQYSLTEQLYTKEELGEAGSILSIDFYSTATERTRNLDIYMVSTDQNYLYKYISVKAFDLVFSGDVTFLQDAWTTITLDTPFEYDGQSNVIIVVDDNTGSYQSNPSFRVFSTQDYQARYTSSYYSNYDPTGSLPYSSYDSGSKQKNQIRVAKDALPAVPKPTWLTVIDIAPTTASLGWTCAAQSFNVRWGTDANLTEWVSTASTSDKQFTLTGLEPETTYYVQVQACDPQKGNSAWATTTLTTIPMLTPPHSLQITAMTKNSATMSWTGYQDFYKVRLYSFERPLVSAFKQVDADVAATEELQQYSFDLSGYSGIGTVAIRYNKSNGGNYLYVDDITLENAQGTVLWTKDFEDGKMPEGWKGVESHSYDDNPWVIMGGNGGPKSRATAKNNAANHHGTYYAASYNRGDIDSWLIIPDVVMGGTLTLCASCYYGGWSGEKPQNPTAEFGVYVSLADEVTIPAINEVKSNVQSPYTFEGLEQGVLYWAGVMGVYTTADYTDWSSLDILIPPYMIGDVNGDFNITPADAIMILYKYFGVEQNGFIAEAADVNLDGHISPADAIEALYIYFGAGSMGGGNYSSRATSAVPSDDLQPE